MLNSGLSYPEAIIIATALWCWTWYVVKRGGA